MESNVYTRKDELPEWPGLVEAMKDVREFGKRTGREAIIGLTPEGDRLFFNEGDANSVAIPEPFNFIPGSMAGCLLVHDHPLFAPLSTEDLRVATVHGVAGIMAVMLDGSWDLAAGLDWSRETAPMLARANNFSRQVAQQIYMAAGPAWAAQEVWAASNLAFLAAADKAGVLKGWKHSYSEEFWKWAGKWVPDIKHGTFRVTGFGMFDRGF